MKLDRSITRLCAALIRRERGGAKVVAIEAGVDASRVSHWMTDEGSVPADAIVPICRGLETIEPLLTMAEALGLDVVPRAEPTTSPVPVHTGVWALLGHTATVGTEVQRAVADGTITPVEAERIREALLQARGTIDGMLARLPSDVVTLRRGA